MDGVPFMISEKFACASDVSSRFMYFKTVTAFFQDE